MSKGNSSQDEQPIPPRFWWLRRGTIGFGLLLALLAALRFWWGNEAQRRIERLAQAAQARGEPSYMTDFAQAPIPDAENAVVPIEAAIDKLERDSGFGIPDLTNGPSAPPLPSELRGLNAMIQHFQPELRLVRSARSRPRVAYSRPQDLDMTMYRWMGQILIPAANCEHTIGDDAAAVEYVHDAIMLADALDQSSVSIIPHLVAMAITRDMLVLLERISPELSNSNHLGRGVSPDQVRSLISALLDERSIQAGAVRGTQGEGRRAISFVPDQGPMANPIAIKVLNPSYKFDGARVYEFESANAQVYFQANFPAARANLKALPIGKASVFEMLTNPVEAWYVDPSPDLPVSVQFRSLTERRSAAIILAIRLYIADHQGKLPGALSELVPTYLPAVPRDPFDPANGPIRYLPKHDPPVLYSVGFNGKDDGGSEKYLPFSELADARWHNEDVVYPLRSKSASPTQDHQGDKEK